MRWPLPLSYHAVYDETALDALEYAHVHGFSGVQLAIEPPHFDFRLIGTAERRSIQEYCRTHRLSLSLHGPDDSASLFVAHPALREGIYAYYADLFDFAYEAGAHLVTIHLGRLADFPTAALPLVRHPPADEAAYRQILDRNLTQVTELVRGRFCLCVENYGWDALAIEVLGPFLADGRLYLCWDYAKTFTRSGEPLAYLFDFFHAHLDQVRQVHLHDLSRGGKGHQALGAGVLDFAPLFAALHGRPVLEYCLEIRPRDQALLSAQYLAAHGFFLGPPPSNLEHGRH